MNNSKSVFALAVTGATLASAIGIASPAGAVNFVYNGNTYDLTTITGSFDNLQATLTSNTWWGDLRLAQGLAGVVQDSLGLPNFSYGPAFTFTSINYLNNPRGIASYEWNPYAMYPSSNYGNSRSDIITFATETAVPVPWEISGSSTIIGTAIGIGLGIGLKRLKGKISKKEE